MSSSQLQYLEYLLKNNWQASVDGRVQDVPYPGDDAIVMAGDVDISRVTQQHTDVIFITEGGNHSITPRSVGWTEEKSEPMATIDVRTSVDRMRLVGTRDGSNNKEAYGGLKGETKRLLETVRKGDKEFDWIDGYEWNPLSEDMGYGFWRGTWEVRFTELAREIDP